MPSKTADWCDLSLAKHVAAPTNVSRTVDRRFKLTTMTTINPSMSDGSASPATTSGTGTTPQPPERRCPRNSPQLISSAEGSHDHAKTSVPQVRELALLVLAAASGTSTSESSASCVPPSSWSKMSPAERVRGLTPSGQAWESSATKRYRSRLAQLMSEHRTSAPVFSSLLPTLTATTYGTNHGGSAGRTGPVRESLQTMAKKGTLLPALTAKGNMLSPSMQKWAGHRNLPTLCARDSKGPGPTHTKGGRDLPSTLGGHLSPTFCEWLMGFPADWTVLGTESKPSATPSCPSAPKSSGT